MFAWRQVISLLVLRLRRTPRVDDTRLGHIFRAADGHFTIDTAANRRLLVRVARNPANHLGRDRFGVIWAAQLMPDGRQIWVQIWNNLITNGGVNSSPRSFNYMTGLSSIEAEEGNNE